jgi:formylglycine-generating enzyme required for sulfatase activity
VTSAFAALLAILSAAPSPASDAGIRAPSEPGALFRDCAECPVMVVLPPGRFEMGSPPGEPEHEGNESPLHEVTIARPFAVGRFEVTLGEFKSFVRASGHRPASGCSTNESDVVSHRSDRDYLNPGLAQTDLHPVVCLSWDDAMAYAEWLSRRTGGRYRLLSEAEWEYAARAGSSAPFPWGAKVTTDQANYDGQYVYDHGPPGLRRKTSLPVGSFPPNAFGLHDMAGNVWEWVMDCLHMDYAGAPADGSPWLGDDETCRSRIRRGGSWDGYAKSVRSANRYWNRTSFRSNYDGFRVAREL